MFGLTGALQARRGAFARAHGGTLFLDEIGELPLALQTKLLHVLEAKEVRPVGAEATRRIDVRIVAATNRAADLDPALLRPGRFDRVIHFDLPPRADRVEIAKYYLGKKAHAPEVNEFEPLGAAPARRVASGNVAAAQESHFYDDVSGDKAGVYEGVRNDAVMNNGFRPTRRVRVPGGTGGLSSITFD